MKSSLKIGIALCVVGAVLVLTTVYRKFDAAQYVHEYAPSSMATSLPHIIYLDTKGLVHIRDIAATSTIMLPGFPTNEEMRDFARFDMAFFVLSWPEASYGIVSPNGKSVLFSRHDYHNNRSHFIKNTVTGSERPFLSGAKNSHLDTGQSSWSPDSRYIVFYDREVGVEYIDVANPDSKIHKVEPFCPEHSWTTDSQAIFCNDFVNKTFFLFEVGKDKMIPLDTSSSLRQISCSQAAIAPDRSNFVCAKSRPLNPDGSIDSRYEFIQYFLDSDLKVTGYRSLGKVTNALDTSDDELSPIFTVASGVHDIRYSPDGRYVMWQSFGPGIIDLVEREIHLIRVPSIRMSTDKGISWYSPDFGTK